MRKTFWISFLVAGWGWLPGQNAPDPLAQSQQRITANDLDGAYDILQKASHDRPDSAVLLTAMGHLDYLRANMPDAEMEFKKAIKLSDKSARAWMGLGQVFEAASLREKAKALYVQAHQVDRNDSIIYSHYARTLSRTERQSAIEAYLAKVDAQDDSESADSARRQLAELKALGGHPAFTLASPLASAEIKLSYLMFDSNRIRGYAVPVSVNGGKPMRLLLDSGASGLMLSRKAAEAAGLTQVTSTMIGGIGDEGEHLAYVSMADTVKVGDVSFQYCPVRVTDRQFLAGEDGILGSNVFAMFLVTIDIKKMLSKLDPLPPHKTAPQDEYWQDREVAPEFANFTSFWHVGHYILLSTSVDGAKPVLFLVDTGSTTSLIDPEYARQFTSVGKEDRIHMKGVSGKVQNVNSTSRLTFQFGRYRQPVPGVLAIPLTKVSRGTPRMTGIFGVTTLVDFRLKIDYRDGLIDLEYVGPKY